MGGLNSGPGPGITLLIAIVLVLAQTASSAPLYEEDEGQESNSQALAESHGCYYNFQHYNEGERILTNEPCLNCTCRNRMLMCYLRVCPFTKGIGQNCTVEKVPGQCCPIITCPEVPVQLLTSTTTEGIKTSGGHHGIKGTAVGHLDTNGCNIDGIFYPNGAQVPSSPEKPCELCYCIRNKTACIMQECALHVDGCRPVYEEGQCFPVRYQCDDSPYEEAPTTTIRPAPTPGLIITTTSSEPLDCSYNEEVYEDGSRIQTEDPCEHCYCLKGKIACAVQECGAQLEKEGQNCTALPPAPGKCCPDSYQCDVTMTSQGLNQGNEATTEVGTPFVTDAGQSTSGYQPDRSTRTTEKPKLTTEELDHVSGTATPTEKGTQNEFTEIHSQGLHPVKPNSTSDDDQKIIFPTNGDEDTKSTTIPGISEVGQPEGPQTEVPESYDHTTGDYIIQGPGEKQPFPESESHKLSVSTEVTVPSKQKPDHLQGTKHPGFTQSQTSHGSSPDGAPNKQTGTKDPLLDKLHNIIQDVQAQVSDGKTTEMPEQVEYQTTIQSQTGHFTEKPDILAHVPPFDSQTGSPTSVETGSTTNGTSPDDSNDIINKLHGIIHGIYSHVTESIMPSKTPESATAPGSIGQLRPEEDAHEKESKPYDASEVPKKPSEEKLGDKTRQPGEKDKYPIMHKTERPKPEDQYGTEYPEKTAFTSVPETSSRYPGKPTGTVLEGTIKLPQRPKPAGSYDEPHETKYPELIYNEEELTNTDNTIGTKRPGLNESPENIENSTDESKKNETPSPLYTPTEKYPDTISATGPTLVGHKPGQKYPDHFKPAQEYPEGFKPGTKYPEDYKPGEASEGVKPGQEYPEGFKPSQKYPEKFRPGQTHEGLKPGEYPEKFKPGQGLEGLKPGEEYPEGYKPGQKYPEDHKPGQQYTEDHKPEKAPAGLKPGEKYPEGYKPGQKYPEEYKPAEAPEGLKPGEYPEKTRPGQGPEGLKPGEEYPEGYKPGQKYPETYKPGQEPEGLKPEKYPDGYKPGQKYPEDHKPGQEYPDGYKPGQKYPETYKPGQEPEGLKPEKYPDGYKPGQKYPEDHKPGQEYPDGYKPGQKYHETYKPEQGPEGLKPGQIYPEDYKPAQEYPEKFKPGQIPEGLKPGQEYPEGYKPGQKYPEKFRPGQTAEGLKPEEEYPEGYKPGQKYPEDYKPEQEYPEKSRPGQAPEGLKPGEEHPEGFKPGQKYSDPKLGQEYPEKFRPGQSPESLKPENEHLEGYKPGQKYPEGMKPGQPGQKYPEDYKPGQRPEGLKPDQEYPEGFKPATKYPEDYKPGKEYPEGHKPQEAPEDSKQEEKFPEGYKPGQKDPERYKPGQEPEELKPGEEYPEGYKPSQKYPEDYKPGQGYPEKFRPEQGPEGLKPGEEFPEGYQPGQKYPDDDKPGQKYPEKFRPVQIPEGLKPGEEYPEGYKPGQKYPDDYKPGQEYPEKFRPEQGPEGLKPGEEFPEGYKPSQKYPDDDKPGQKYPEKFRPGQGPEGVEPEEEYPEGYKPGQKYPEKFRPAQIPEGLKPGEEYPEGYKPGQKYPEKFRPAQIPEGLKPGEEYPEGYKPGQKYPDDYKPGQEYSEKFRPEQGPEGLKPGEEFPEGYQPGQKYPDDDKPGQKYPEKFRPEQGPEGLKPGEEFPEGYKPNQKYPEKFRPGQGPEGVKPEEEYPEGYKPGQKYPEKFRPVQIPEGLKPGEEYPEGYQPGQKYPDDDEPGQKYPEKFRPEQGPEGLKPGEEFPEGYKPNQKYPEKFRPGQIPEGLKPGEEYPEGQKPGQKYPEDHKPGHAPEGLKPGEEYPEGYKPGQKHPEGSKPDQGPFGDKKPTEKYPDGVTPTREDSVEYKPTVSYSEKLKPGDHPTSVEPEEDYTAETKYTSLRPNKFRPTYSTDKPIGIENLEGVTGEPDYKSPEETKPSSPFSDDTVKPVEEQPTGSDESESVTSKPSHADKYPEYPHETKLPVTGRPTESGPYSTKHPEELEFTSLPENLNKYSEKQRPVKPGVTTRPELSTKYPQKPGLTGTSETSTTYFENDTFKPDGESAYPNRHTPGKRPGGTKPEGSKYPETTEIGEGPEDQTTYPEGFVPTTHYPEGLNPDNYLGGYKRPTKRPLGSVKYPTESDEAGTESPNETESSKKPFDGTSSQTTRRPEGFDGIDVNLHESKYPVTSKPEGTNLDTERPYSTEGPEGSRFTGKPEDESKYPEGFKPISGHPQRPKPSSEGELPGTEYPEVTGEPEYSSEGSTVKYPEKGEQTKKPGFDEYPDRLKPTHQQPTLPSGMEEHSKYPQKPGFESKPTDSTSEPKEQYSTQPDDNLVTEEPGSDDDLKYPGKTTKRPFVGGKYPQKQKPEYELPGTEYPTGVTGSPEHPEGFKPLDEEGETRRPESSTIGLHPGYSKRPVGSQRPVPVYNTEHPQVGEGTKPSEGFDISEDSSKTGRPHGSNKYPEKFGTQLPDVTDQPGGDFTPVFSQKPTAPGKHPQSKPEDNELYTAGHTEAPEMTFAPDVEYKPHGTEYPEEVSGRPVHSNKFPDKTKVPGKSPQESSTGRPDEENPEDVTAESHGSEKYPEESYVTQHPEKIKPQSADQLLETGSKPSDTGKYPGSKRPVTEQYETDEPQYPEKLKPSSEHTKKRPPYSDTPSGLDYSKEPGQPGKPPVAFDNAEVTKRPYYTTEAPGKPGSQYPEETGKPQYPEESKHPGKEKPSKHPGKPELGNLPYHTESPEAGRPIHTEHTFYPGETEITDKPEDSGKFPENFKPGFPDKTKVQYPTTFDPEKESIGDVTDKPLQKHTEKEKEPIKSKPETEESVIFDDVEFPEGVTSETEYPVQESEKLGTTKKPEGGKYPQKPEDEVFGTKYPEAGTGRPEGDIFQPTEQEYQQETEHPKFPSGPENEPKYPESGVTGRPQDQTEYPEGLTTGKHTQRPLEAGSYPEGHKPQDSELLPGVGYPDNEMTVRPGHPEGHYPGVKPGKGELQGTEYPDSTSKDYSKYPDEYTQGGNNLGATGRPQNLVPGSHEGVTEESYESTQYPEGLKPEEQSPGQPQGSHKYPDGAEYPEGVSGEPDENTKYPDRLGSTGAYPGVTSRPLDKTKYPGVTVRPDDRTKYPETYKPTGKPHYPEYGKPQSGESPYGTEYPESATAIPEGHSKYPEEFGTTGLYSGETDKPQEHKKRPDGFKPINFYPGKPQSSEKYPEDGKPQSGEPPFGTELPEDHTDYSEGFRPTEHYPVDTGKPQGFTEHPEPGRPFSTKYPETGQPEKPQDLTKHPESIKPAVHYPGESQNVHDSSEYPSTKETDRPEGTTKYSGIPEYSTKHPIGFGGAQDVYSTIKPFEESEQTELSTEYPSISGVTGKYPVTFKPGQDRPYSGSSTEYPEGEEPTKVHSHGSERPVPFGKPSEKPFESNKTHRPDVLTKPQDKIKPVSSESTEFPESTGRPEDTKFPEESETEYPENTTDRPEEGSKYPNQFRPTGEYPEDSKHPVTKHPLGFIKYPQRPKPESEVESYGTEYPKTTGYPQEGSTGKYPQYPGTESPEFSGQPEDLTQYPGELKPSQKRPVPGDKPIEGISKYPSSEKPESGGSPEAAVTGEIEESEHPEGFKPTEEYPHETKYPGTGRPDIKFTQSPKPSESYYSTHVTEIPETTDSEEPKVTKISDYFDRRPGVQYPQRPKPQDDYSEGVTSLPEGISAGIYKRPTKRPGSENESFVTEYPEGTGFDGTKRPLFTRPRPTGSKPQQGFDNENYGAETTSKPDLDNEIQGTEYPEVTEKYPHRPTDRPYKPDFPEAYKPGFTGRPKVPTRYPEGTEIYPTEQAGAPEDLNKLSTVHPQEIEDVQKPQGTTERPERSSTTKYPDGFKPIGQYPEGDERPHVTSQYPYSPTAGASGYVPHGEGFSKTTAKPEDDTHTELQERPGVTVRPEDENYPESSTETGKPHGVYKYPQRPKPTGFETESSGTEYPDTTDQYEETLATKRPDAFGQYYPSSKPSTEYPDQSKVTGRPVGPGKYPHTNKPDYDESLGTALPDEKQKPEEYEPSKFPESASENIPYGTQSPDGETVKPVGVGKHPDEVSSHGLTKYPSRPIDEDEERPYSTEFPPTSGGTEKQEGLAPQKPENEIYGTETPEVTKGTPTYESSTKYPAHMTTVKPGMSYLPQEGEVPSEKIPTYLDENSVPGISEHPTVSETEVTDRVPATGSPTDTVQQIGGDENKPASADLTHETGSSPTSEDRSPGQSTTAPHGQYPAKPTEGIKPIESSKPEEGASDDDYSGKPKPTVPGEGLYDLKEPTFVEPSENYGVVNFPTKVSETKRPDVFGTEKPSDEDQQTTEEPHRYSSPSRPGTHKYPGTVHQSTGDDVQYPERVSTGGPGEDLTTPGKHEVGPVRQTTDGSHEGTGHLGGAFNTEIPIDYTTYEGVTNVPLQGSTPQGTPQNIRLPEKDSAGVQKTTAHDNDLINKLHNIISGIQSQVTDGKTTKVPQAIYESTPSTETPQDYRPSGDKFGRPEQKPQEFGKYPQGQTSESSTTPTDGVFSSENEIYEQTTTDAEAQTDGTHFGYPFSGVSTELPVFIPSKGPAGISPDETGDNLSTNSPYLGTAEYPHGTKPNGTAEKPGSTHLSELEKIDVTDHPESAIPTKITFYPGQFHPTSKHPFDELSSTGKPKPESDSSYPYPGKPDSTPGVEVTTTGEAGSETYSKPYEGSTSHPHTGDRTTQIYEEVKGDKKPIENVDNLIAEENTTSTIKPDVGIIHTVIPQDVTQKHPGSIPTEKPLHVVYPTYYPEGVVTRKPEEITDKKVTVTPQSAIHEGTSTVRPDSGSTSVPGFEETHTVYEVHTEISSESSTTSPVVIIEEVHTEVHSERATTKPAIAQTSTPAGSTGPDYGQGKPHDQRPEANFEGSTNKPELASHTPQIVFGRPAIVQPTGDKTTLDGQTLPPQTDLPENEKSALSTHAEYPTKPESSTVPEFVTVTPVIVVPVTKESQHIMHLYSPKDKHPTSSVVFSEPYTTLPPIFSEGVKQTTKEGESAQETQAPTFFDSEFGTGTTFRPEILGTRFPSRKTTQKPTDGVPVYQEGSTFTPTEGISEESEAPFVVKPSVTQRPSYVFSTQGLPTEDKTQEGPGFTTADTVTTHPPQGASFIPFKLINGTKIYYPEKESPEKPAPESSPYDGYDLIPYEVVNGTKFFYPNRVVTSRPFTTTTTAPSMGMYVPYKIINGTKVYYTQERPQKPEKFDGFDYVPFDLVNGTKVFYPEKVTTTPTPTSAMYVPFKIIDGTKVYYPKDAQEEPQNIPDDYDGFDYVPYVVVNGNKVFQPDQIPGREPTTTERLPAMYVPYKLINGNRIYYPKDAQTKPESVPEEYDGFDLVPYEVVNGTKLFYPDQAATQEPEQNVPGTSTMFVPYKIVNETTKVYFPKDAQDKPSDLPEGYDGFDSLPYKIVNGSKVFQTERVTPQPEYTSTPAYYPSGMFVPYKIINNTKVFFPKDAQHNPRPLKPTYDGIQYLPYDVINGTKVFYPEKVPSSSEPSTTPEVSAMYVPYKIINGTKVYFGDKATENPEEIPEGYEGFDYVPYEIVNGHKLFYPDRVAPTMGMYVPYKKVNGTKVYYPKDSSEKRRPVPEGYDGVDYIPYEIINGTRVFYPDRATTSRPHLVMYVPYKKINGTKVYYPNDAHQKPYLVPQGYDGFDPLPYEIVNGTKVFHPEDSTPRPTPAYPQGMFVPYKIINGTKVYYPQEAHKRPHPLSDEYSGLDYIPYEIVNGTKVFHPERVTPSTLPTMYIPYKLINGTKVFYPKHAQNDPQKIPIGFDGFDYVPYEIINGTRVFHPNRIPSYQGMYVPYKIINGNKVFYPKHAQHKPTDVPEGYDGFDYLPYENVNGTKVFKPVETTTDSPNEQAMYVPYKIVNGTKVFYSKYAQQKPHNIPQGFDGFEYIPYEIVNGTKIFNPELTTTPSAFNKPAMYVPYKIVDGKKVYYPKYAQNKPYLVPEGYDGFDYIPYEIVNGTKVFNPEAAFVPGSTFRPGLYVPYKIINGIKVYQPKHAQQKPTQVPQGYVGFDYLPYDVINGNKVFYPESSTPFKQAMFVPYKWMNGTKVFYPKYAQLIPTQPPEGYDGFEYIPYEIVNGNKVFHPDQITTTENPFRAAMYVPYRIVNATKVYYPKNAQNSPQLIPSDFDGFDYIPYEVVNGNKVFHPEKVITPGTFSKQAMYVPFRVINGTKTYYPKYAQHKPQLIPEGYDGFDYLPYEIVNGTKVFNPEVTGKPTYLQGMYVPYKLANNTKVFYPKDAHNRPNYVPKGYDGADYVPYEIVNNTKMFYPELISTAQPTKIGSAGVYVPFKVINNKKVFYPKEATPFPPTVRYPYDGVAFVPHKVLGETSPSEIVYVDSDEAFKPQKPSTQLGKVPGEGSCYLNNKTFANNTEIPPVSPCQARCMCVSSVVRCVRVKCPLPPENKLDCSPVYREGSCCPTYACGDLDYENPITAGFTEVKVSESTGTPSSGYDFDATTAVPEYVTQKTPSYETGSGAGGKKPEHQAPFEEYHLHKPPKPKPSEHDSLEPYDSVEGQLTPEEDYDVEDEEPYGPGTCRYAGKVYVSAQQIPRDDPCDFCFCFRSDIICLQQSCPPPIPGCRDEPIQGFCCPRYECHVKMATVLNVTSTTTTTTTTLPPHFFPQAFKGSATRTGCFVQGRAYRVGQAISSASGPCMDCICGGNGRMKCEPKVCTPEPMIRKMISPSENATTPTSER